MSPTLSVFVVTPDVHKHALYAYKHFVKFVNPTSECYVTLCRLQWFHDF